ncbi:MAG: PIN domain-containing protein [Mariniphaga sp.]|jgi:predicted nucleic acid-binding protein|nr:PIN domain-containing protein [Mariniphaga sp.]
MEKYLIDTNIFLEILLEQEKKEKCKSFLVENYGKIVLSDFSLHSIGVILFRNQKYSLYSSFINDVIPKVKIASIEKGKYFRIEEFAVQFNLDFDDSYQAVISEDLNLTIVTMDKDFEQIKKHIKIKFLK